MRILTAFLVFFFASHIACAEDCVPESISLYSDQDSDVQVFFDIAPAKSTTVQVFSEDKLVRRIVADRNGAFRLDRLPEGKYQFVIAGEGNLGLTVLARKSGLNGPWIIWSLFPKSKFKWVGGKKILGHQCPIVVIRGG